MEVWSIQWNKMRFLPSCTCINITNFLVLHISAGILSILAAFILLIFFSNTSSSSPINCPCLMCCCLLRIIVIGLSVTFGKFPSRFLYGYTTWMLTKHIKKKLDRDDTGMFHVVWNKSWKRNLKKQQLYSHLPPIT